MIEVNAGGRLDRLPICSFHYRVLGLVAAGMFFDAFEIYLGAGVLAALVQSGWSDLAQNGVFISSTFAGMMIGAWLAGAFGDRYGRRFSYQLNLLIFGLSSFAAALCPSMNWLIAARFVMGIGLGAEIVVGYVMLTEFAPARQRGDSGSSRLKRQTSRAPTPVITNIHRQPNEGMIRKPPKAEKNRAEVVIAASAEPHRPRWRAGANSVTIT